MPKKGTQKLKVLRRRLLRSKQRAEVRRRTQRRKEKENERELESASLPNLQKNNEKPEGMSQEEWDNFLNFIDEEQERERRNAEQKARMLAYIDGLPKNTFYIRVNDHERFYKMYELVNILRNPAYRLHNLYILYLGDTLDTSTYFHFRESSYYEPDMYMHILAWEISEGNPIAFFFGHHSLFPDTWKENVLGYYKLSKDRLLQVIEEKFPGFLKQAEKTRLAVYTAPSKVKSLQQKGLDVFVERLQKKAGQDLPPNTQNLIESYMFERKPPQQYFEGRDNLARIQTNLFQKNL